MEISTRYWKARNQKNRNISTEHTEMKSKELHWDRGTRGADERDFLHEYTASRMRHAN
jgi:hypothetical protein